MPSLKSDTPKIYCWDLETGYNVVRLFQLFNKYINFNAIQQERYIICGSIKELNKNTIQSVSLLDNASAFKKDPTNDRHVCVALRNLLKDADALIGHNADNFDIKFLNTRMLFHGLPPLPPVVQIDTLKIAKHKFRFNSNRLDYIARLLGVGKKYKVTEELWARCLGGDSAAVREMVKYNRVDVAILEKVYNKLSPYARTQLNPNLWANGSVVCSNAACGGNNLTKHKNRISLTRSYTQYQCQDCGKYTSVTTANNSVIAK